MVNSGAAHARSPPRRTLRIGCPPVVIVADAEFLAQEAVAHVALAYGLTRAEARLLESLTLLEAAEALALIEATVRILWGRVFVKTGTERQVELVRHVLAMRPPSRPD